MSEDDVLDLNDEGVAAATAAVTDRLVVREQSTALMHGASPGSLAYAAVTAYQRHLRAVPESDELRAAARELVVAVRMHNAGAHPAEPWPFIRWPEEDRLSRLLGMAQDSLSPDEAAGGE